MNVSPKVPLLDLQAQLAPIRQEILKAVTEVIDSTQYIMGPKVAELESCIAAYCNVAYGIGVSSGTDALLASLMGLGIKAGDRVLTTPYSFIATIGCILRLGAIPVFADIDPLTYNIDPQKMAEILADSKDGDKIKAILPVHLFGQCADMSPIMALAEEYGLPVLEDAAQAIGASYPWQEEKQVAWKKAGSFGIAGCFSFFPSKNLGGIGDGGMVVTDDENFEKKIRIIMAHGASPKYYHIMVGGNFRLDPIQAAALKVKFGYLPEWHASRRENARQYNSLLEESGLIEKGLVQTPRAVYESKTGAGKQDYHIYNQYVVRVQNRDSLRAFLAENNVGVEVYYPLPLHRQGCVQGLGYEKQTFPEAEKAAAETLALPIYPELTEAMQEKVVDSIKEFYRLNS